MKIDFVIPWVDGNDIIWQNKKRKYDKSKKRDYTNSDMRYRDWGTLKYVMRSIEKNCPWYNKIYLITEGHYPAWLDINHSKIQLICHDDLYFDKSHLPTFSSSSIEMNLSNIKNLSEYFIYMNDDTLIMKPLKQDRFFMYGKPVDFLSHGWIPRNKFFKKIRGMNAWANSLKNNIDLINRKFIPIKLENKFIFHKSYSLRIKISNFLMKYFYHKIIWLEHWHHPIPYLKTTLQDVFSEYKLEMMECSSNRFRADNDLTQYIYRYWQLASGNFYPYRYNDGKFLKIEVLKDMELCVNEIEFYNFYCPNDSISDEISDMENKEIEKILITKLKEVFSTKASFEKEYENE